MIICPNCGYESPETANFCPKCGNKLEHKSFCLNCGEELIPGMHFCPACGTKVGTAPNDVKVVVPPTVPAKADTQEIFDVQEFEEVQEIFDVQEFVEVNDAKDEEYPIHNRMDNHLYEQIVVDPSKNNIDSIAELEKYWNRDHNPEIAAWLGMLYLGTVKKNKPDTWKKAVDMLEYADANGVYTFSYLLGFHYTVFDCQPEKAMLYYGHDYSLGYMRHDDYLIYEEYLEDAGQKEKLSEVYKAHIESIYSDPEKREELLELQKKLAELE